MALNKLQVWADFPFHCWLRGGVALPCHCGLGLQQTLVCSVAVTRAQATQQLLGPHFQEEMPFRDEEIEVGPKKMRKCRIPRRAEKLKETVRRASQESERERNQAVQINGITAVYTHKKINQTLCVTGEPETQTQVPDS